MRSLLLTCIFLAAASPAGAGPFAYAATLRGYFGVLDLGSGNFVQCGYMGGTYLLGFAALKNGPLYSLDDAWFYRVNPHTGALTKIARAGNYVVAFGSTEHIIYAADSFGDLYTIDPETGVETEVGKGVPAGDDILELSASGLTLYEITPLGLYDFIPRESLAHRKSPPSSMGWGALAVVDGVLYGLGVPGPGYTFQSVYTISTADGTATAIAPLSIGGLDSITALAPAAPDNTGTCRIQQ